MRRDFYYPSRGGGRVHGRRWLPDGAPKAVVQIVHGIGEHVDRYNDFAAYLNEQGYLVAAEDHMGHGRSITEESPRGYFSGGWFAAVEDTYQLYVNTRDKYPGVPYILFGHSMGSFMVRTILAKYPDAPFGGAVICGTGWMPTAVVRSGKSMASMVCRMNGERNPSTLLQKLMFGGYNKRIEHPRTPSDWLSRDEAMVDAYEADPLCGFIPAAGLARDMMEGILYIQKAENLRKMNKELPVFFIAGEEDPVGDYGRSVEQTVDEFVKCGMLRVSGKIYPECRHEILNELNKEEVYEDVKNWIESVI